MAVVKSFVGGKTKKRDSFPTANLAGGGGGIFAP